MSSSAVLFHNSDKTVILLDLPMSIALAQHLQPRTTNRQLLSSKSREVPYPSIEPKSVKGGQKLLSQTSDSDRQYHAEIQNLVRHGLQQIRSDYYGPWCLERQLVESSRNNTSLEDEHLKAGAVVQKHDAEICPPIILSCPMTEFPNVDSIADSMVVNSNGEETQLRIPGVSFRIPPMSAFLLSDVTRTQRHFSAIVNSIMSRSPDLDIGLFEFIVVDPPWSNRSARRSRVYLTAEDQLRDPFESILFVFEQHVASNGVVAIWVTNKESVRSKVVRELLQCGLHLLEEWVWIKVTKSGDPVTVLGGLWKHPYEICLVFRKNLDITSPSSYRPRRRILAAVPDLHSRKPNLKELAMVLFPDLERQWGLEIFARHLTAGWVSWGNEVLEYANERGWLATTV